MRVAVVGIGGIGRIHVEYLGRAKEAQVVAVADLDQAKASKVQAEYKVPKAYVDYREMMDKEKPEAVFICTPPATASPAGLGRCRQPAVPGRAAPARPRPGPSRGRVGHADGS